jgi:mono/diheme cytochrome c family protein
MTHPSRTKAVLATFVLVASTMCFAQGPGEATYKAKCQNCHGVSGMADTGMGKALKVKPINDPTVAKLPLAEMIEATRNGQGKMPAYKTTLSDAEIRASVDFFRSFLK